MREGGGEEEGGRESSRSPSVRSMEVPEGRERRPAGLRKGEEKEGRGAEALDEGVEEEEGPESTKRSDEGGDGGEGEEGGTSKGFEGSSPLERARIVGRERGG